MAPSPTEFAPSMYTAETTRSGATVLIFADAAVACREAAERIANQIRTTVARRGKAVLGLATGATPIPVYERLVELHRAGSLSFADVTTYNLDEYYPISPLDPRSYRSYMQLHLFAAVDLAPNRAHVFDGTVPETSANEHAAAYDRWIAADGGLDFQLLGIGRNGHIGFNEPEERPLGEALALPSRVVELHPVTLADAARDFEGDQSRVPRRALTLGITPIQGARSILVLAFGRSKAEPFRQSIEGPMTSTLPGSLLQSAGSRVTWIVDRAASGR